MGDADPGVVNRVTRPILRDNLLITKSEKGQVTDFCFSFIPPSIIIPLSLPFPAEFVPLARFPCTPDDSSTVAVIIHVFFSKQLLAQLCHHLGSAR